LLQIGQEFTYPRSVLRHAVFGHQVRVTLEAQQFGLLAPQLQNLLHGGRVVAGSPGRPRVVGPEHLLANSRVVQIGHYGAVAGFLKREPPPVEALLLGALASRGARRFRKAREFGFLFDYQFKGVGRIQNVVGELLPEPGEFNADLAQARPLLAAQSCAAAPIVVQGHFQEPLARPGQGPGFRRSGVLLQPSVDPLVQSDVGGELRVLRQHGIDRRPQGGSARHRLQVPGDSHPAFQVVGDVLESRQRVLVCRRAGVGDVGGPLLLGLGQKGGDSGLDVRRTDPVEGDAEALLEKRVFHRSGTRAERCGKQNRGCFCHNINDTRATGSSERMAEVQRRPSRAERPQVKKGGTPSPGGNCSQNPQPRARHCCGQDGKALFFMGSAEIVGLSGVDTRRTQK